MNLRSDVERGERKGGEDTDVKGCGKRQKQQKRLKGHRGGIKQRRRTYRGPKVTI